ncbi:hypothetical protein BC826DRAFT_1152931 [Russula brevipes]|nr:hypothetical protein BC826DRAFT_1152931 [Russula brevipes]
MRFGFSILPAFLRSFGGRKAPSSSRNTHLPNIFARRNPHLAARSASLRATKSAARIRNRPPAACMTWRSSSFAAHGAKPHGGGNPSARHRRTAPRPLRRCNTVFVPPPAKHAELPQLPGAYVLEPSSLVPGFPDQGQDQADGQLTPLVRQKLFLDALYAGRQALLRAAGERQKEAAARRRAEDAEYRRLLERDAGKAQAAHRQAEAEEFARLLREDRRRAQEAHRRAVDEDFARLLEEDRRRAQEAQRRAEAREAARRAREQAAEEERRRLAAQAEAAQEKRRRLAEQEEAMERARREREREHREREYYSFPVAVTGAAHVHPDEWLRRYEVKWVALRSNVTRVEPFRFRDIPWPVFWDVQSDKDIVEEGVVAFMRHLLPDCAQGQGGGLAKSLRSEILRWHPDKFKGQVLDKVVECDRQGVWEAAEKVVRILTQLSAEMRQP